MNNSKKNASYILLLSLSISGCELLGPKLNDKLPLESVEQLSKVDSSDEVLYQELSNQRPGSAGEEAAKTEIYPGTGQFISQKSGKGKKSSGKGAYSLNFDEADLAEVVKVILSDILAENYVLSPKVSGKVTLQTTNPLAKEELLPTLDMLLEINNAAMVVQDGVFQIKPKSDALTSSAFSTYSNYKHKIPGGYQVRVVPVKNVAVEELSEIIRPLMQDKSILHVDSTRNMMLIAGSASELARAMEMVEAFDVDVMKGRSFGLFPLKNVEATKMIEELEQVFNKKQADSGNGLFQFMEIERLNAILAITQQAKFLKDIERWIIRLDRANSAAGGGVIVYRAQHVDAAELAATLNDIFSNSGQSSRPASVAAGKKTVEITNKAKTALKTPAKTKKTRKNNTPMSIADVGEINIIADEVNNAVIIVATAQDYAVVQQVIKQLDVMPLQVLIDATIVDVTLKDDLKYGIKWALNHNSGGDNAASSNGGEFLTNAAAIATAATTGGFGYAFVSNDINAVLTAQASKGNVNIVSSPSLMVLNNQEASIQVGNEISLKTADVANTNSSGTVTTTFEQRKTGVSVDVKPRVNASGLVIMEIQQSIESFGADSSGTSGNPDILTREIKSSVAVQSGETIVLGGLISETDTFSKGGVPFLHELPLIGSLFGSTSKNKIKTELVLLITPRVVKSKLDARLVTNEFKRKLSGIYKEAVELEQQ